MSLSTLFYSLKKSFCAVQTIYNFDRYGIGTREGSTTMFSFFWSKLSFILFLYCLWFSFTYDIEITFVVFQFHVQWHKIHSIWLTNEKNIGKCLMIGTCLIMGSSTLVQSNNFFFEIFSSCITHLDSNKLACAIFYENCWTYVVVVTVIW